MVHLQNVVLKYGGKIILKGINEQFNNNVFACIIGKNGAGKSTLLRALAGLMPYCGNITHNGVELQTMKKQNRAQHISYIPQTRPIPASDVRTLISHGRFPHLGFSKTLSTVDIEKIEAAAIIAGVEDLLHRDVLSLSGGERQRVYIAMCIAQDAQLMIMDEPTVFLDIDYQLQIIELLKNLHKNKSIIIAIHDLQLAFTIAQQIILVSGQSLVNLGAPESCCNNTLLQKTFGLALKGNSSSGSIYHYQLERL
ncbi:ferrichrome ABC transporter ATP-binding protein [Spirochaetia bacterium]|nr:ferrichrome ABC transporter ATP-binding protein [Spirochaetia bacterium]